MRKKLVFFCVLALCVVLAVQSFAAEFPVKPVRLIVPFAAGGAADMTARLASQVAEKYLGQPIVIENRAGGGGVTGTNAGAKAAPDGYTLTLLVPGAILNTYLKKVQYTMDSFIPIVQIIQEFDVVVAHKSEFADLGALRAYALEHPKAVKIGVSGAMIYDHLEALILSKAMGVELTPVPFNGSAPAIAAFLGKHVNLCLASFAELSEQEKAGEVTFLCVFAENRFPDYPNVSTARELGYDIVMGPWRGIVAPKGTPEEVIDTIANAYIQAFNDPAFKEVFEKAGLPADSWKNREDFTKQVQTQSKELKKVIDEATAGEAVAKP